MNGQMNGWDETTIYMMVTAADGSRVSGWCVAPCLKAGENLSVMLDDTPSAKPLYQSH